MSKKSLNVFVPITKVDAKKGVVYGILAAEETDRSGEVFDYKGSKPYFEKWSEAASKATNGASLGNLRAMHGNVAAGKFTDIHFNDKENRIEVAAKVVDKNELDKVLEGVYTGFSIGGKYVSRKKDGDVYRYVCDPVEGSLVDLPCIPSAQFEIVKADGAVVQKNFKPTNEVETKARELSKAAGENPDEEVALDSGKKVAKWLTHEDAALKALVYGDDEPAAPVEPSNDEVAAKARDLAKAAGKEDSWADFFGQAREELKKAGGKKTKDKEVTTAEEDDDEDEEAADAAGKSAGAEPWKQVWTHPELPGQTFEKKGEMQSALATKRAGKTAADISAPVDDALKAINDTLDARDQQTVKFGTFRDGADKANVAALFKAAGIEADDGAAVVDFIAANVREDNETLKAADGRDLTVDKAGKVVAISDELKADLVKMVGLAADAAEKRDFDDDKRKAMAKDGSAMKDGSFPIASKADLKNAVKAWGRSKNKSAAKRHIIRRAKALDAVDLLPDDWHVKTVAVVDVKKVADGDVKKAASLYVVGRLIETLATMRSLEECLECQGYGSDVVLPKDMTTRMGTMVVDFGDFLAEVLDEVLQAIRDDEAEEASKSVSVLMDAVHALTAAPLAKLGVAVDADVLKRATDAIDVLTGAAEIDGGDVGEIKKQMAGERKAFETAIDKIGESLKGVAARLKKIEDAPLPEGTSTVTRGLTVHSKTGDDDAPQMDDANKRAYAEMTGELARLGAVKLPEAEPFKRI